MKNLNHFCARQLCIVLMIASLSFIANRADATVYTMNLVLSGSQEAPANLSPALGTLLGTYDDATNELNIILAFNGLVGTTTASHFHGPADPGVNGPVQIALTGFPVGVNHASYANTFTLTDEQESQLICGTWYVNIHTTAFPGGEIRAQVEGAPAVGNITPFDIGLIGSNEAPPNSSPATGTLSGTYDQVTKLLTVSLNFNGMLGTTTAAHIHGPAGPGVNGPVVIPLAGFPVGVNSGAYANAFVLTPEQETNLFAGLLYVNIHTTFYPGGEIRGQLVHGTLTGDCGTPSIPVSDWALLLGGLLIMTFTFLATRKRS